MKESLQEVELRLRSVEAEKVAVENERDRLKEQLDDRDKAVQTYRNLLQIKKEEVTQVGLVRKGAVVVVVE